MARPRSTDITDPTTGKPLPQGVAYRGPGQYRARKLVDGRRVTKTFTKALHAQRWLAEVEVDHSRGLFLDRTEAERQTLGDLIRRYQEEVLGSDSEKRGADKERGHLKIVLQDAVCQIRMARLRPTDLAQFRDRMKSLEYAPATIVRRLNLIQTIIQHARREWDVNLAENPAQMVKRPTGADRKRDRVFQDVIPAEMVSPLTEEERLLNACDADANPLLGPIVRFAITTAMRQGEIVGLRWEDINWGKNTALVRGAAGTITKNGDVREIPLLPGALAVLTDLDPRKDGPVFPIDQNVLKMRYRRVVRKAGIADLTFHDLRHIATSRLARIYTNPLDLKRVTGHRDLKSLDRYYHATAADLAVLGTTVQPSEVKKQTRQSRGASAPTSSAAPS